MKENDDFNSKKFTSLLLSCFFYFLSPLVWGQVPQGIPKEMGPVDFSSTANIIIFIVLPIIVLIAFFLWRAEVKRRKNENKEDL